MASPLRLVERVAAARHRMFVGRDAERQVFRHAVTAPELPFYVLYVFGPGGVGKTTLLREYARICDEVGLPYSYLDGRDVEPVPESFISALSRSMGLDGSTSPAEAMVAAGHRYVLLVDTYEALGPLDSWLRNRFLPELPEDCFVVLADRQGPASGWRVDPGWQALVKVLPLRNLTRVESDEYLSLRDIPSEHHPAVLEFTHGHPLALSLVAEVFAQRPNFAFRPESSPDVVKLLLEQLVQKVPSPAHRAALEACSLVRLTTEPLLAGMLATTDAHELFDWLRGLSFVESGPLGIFPRDLAREALAADLRWRNPDWHAELHRRARTYYSARLRQTWGRDQQLVIFDYVYLYRDNQVIRPYFEWQESGTTLPDAVQPADVPEILRLVRRHEGVESARLAEFWLQRQPQGMLVFRGAGHEILGFMQMVALHVASLGDLRADPAAESAWEYLQGHAPLRPGEGATLFRFWMAKDTYQSVSSVQSLIFVNAARHYLVAPALAFTFFPSADPAFWASGFEYVDLHRIWEADFSVGGRTYGVYGHDWRAVPPAAWLALLGERETSASPLSATPPDVRQPVVVLSEPDFEAAVRDALQKMSHLNGLRSNPLIRSRMVVDRAGSSAGLPERAAALQSLVTEAADSLRASPRQEKAYLALYHTYLHPAPTQEAAAEILDLPFSTFRRHLKTGVLRITDALWLLEIGGDR